MSILEERMPMHWLTPITSSPCSRLVSYCVQSSSTQHPSSSPSVMSFRPTRLLSLISHTCESALTCLLWLHLMSNHLTHGHSHKTVSYFATRDSYTYLTTRTPDWISCT